MADPMYRWTVGHEHGTSKDTDEQKMEQEDSRNKVAAYALLRREDKNDMTAHTISRIHKNLPDTAWVVSWEYNVQPHNAEEWGALGSNGATIQFITVQGDFKYQTQSFPDGASNFADGAKQHNTHPASRGKSASPSPSKWDWLQEQIRNLKGRQYEMKVKLSEVHMLTMKKQGAPASAGASS